MRYEIIVDATCHEQEQLQQIVDSRGNVKQNCINFMKSKSDGDAT